MGLGFELRGPKHEPEKFQVIWFTKERKIMVNKKFHFVR